MLVYAGIDEAGYGPMLGPLCVALTAFVLEDHDPAAGPPDLWKLLDRALCRSRRDRRGRIAVDDSKKLKTASKGAAHPLKHLERGVLSFCLAGEPDLLNTSSGAMGKGSPRPLPVSEGVPESNHGDDPTSHEPPEVPTTDDALFQLLGARVPDEPWYRAGTDLPLAESIDALKIDAGRLRRCMSDARIHCAIKRCEVIDAGQLNRQVQLTGTKAALNLGCALKLVDLVWRRWPAEHPRIIVDRHGGRIHYRQELQLAFPDAELQILAETEALSRYRMSRGGSMVTVSFARAAEDSHLPVALASMIAKYTRELLMLRLNRFFAGHLPELKPTAGYVQDARRYLSDIEPVIRRLDLPRGELVRSR